MPKTHPVHQYENELTKILTKLDEVESNGVVSIREARKSSVKAIDVELGMLDEKKAALWNLHHTRTPKTFHSIPLQT